MIEWKVLTSSSVSLKLYIENPHKFYKRISNLLLNIKEVAFRATSF